jgi:hypothetical protein
MFMMCYLPTALSKSSSWTGPLAPQTFFSVVVQEPAKRYSLSSNSRLTNVVKGISVHSLHQFDTILKLGSNAGNGTSSYQGCGSGSVSGLDPDSIALYFHDRYSKLDPKHREKLKHLCLSKVSERFIYHKSDLFGQLE